MDAELECMLTNPKDYDWVVRFNIYSSLTIFEAYKQSQQTDFINHVGPVTGFDIQADKYQFKCRFVGSREELCRLIKHYHLPIQKSLQEQAQEHIEALYWLRYFM